MPLLRTTTHTSVHNAVRFADPYKRCLACGQWIDGYLDVKEGVYPLIPCGHRFAYEDVCPSWGPVDGCRCPDGGHPMRPRPAEPDGHVY